MNGPRKNEGHYLEVDLFIQGTYLHFFMGLMGKGKKVGIRYSIKINKSIKKRNHKRKINKEKKEITK